LLGPRIDSNSTRLSCSLVHAVPRKRMGKSETRGKRWWDYIFTLSIFFLRHTRDIHPWNKRRAKGVDNSKCKESWLAEWSGCSAQPPSLSRATSFRFPGSRARVPRDGTRQRKENRQWGKAKANTDNVGPVRH
jgi:hypothetical protein